MATRVTTTLTPKIIYGTAWKKEATSEHVRSAVLHGFRALDTAGQPKHYREDLVGDAVAQLVEEKVVSRAELFIQTKFTPCGKDSIQKLPYSPSDPISTQIRTSHGASLRNLHTTYIDSYLLHSPLDTLEETLEAWRVMAELQDEGAVRLIGVSNTYETRVLAALDKIRKVQIVQNRWYEGNEWDKKVVGYCKAHGIIYQSFWTLSGSPTLLAHPALLRIARQTGYTPAQVLFKFAQLQGVVPLSGTTSAIHMHEDLEVENLHLPVDDFISESLTIRRLIGGDLEMKET